MLDCDVGRVIGWLAQYATLLWLVMRSWKLEVEGGYRVADIFKMKVFEIETNSEAIMELRQRCKLDQCKEKPWDLLHVCMLKYVVGGKHDGGGLHSVRTAEFHHSA
jgi:hypothetical protein